MKCIMRLPDLPSVTLTNGLVVANYSSPHSFLFEDGTILEKCSDERATITKLDVQESHQCTDAILTSIKVEWYLTWFLQEEIEKILTVWDRDELPWDVIITPLPLLQTMTFKNTVLYGRLSTCDHPFRTGRLVDRLEPKKLSISKFCVI